MQAEIPAQQGRIGGGWGGGGGVGWGTAPRGMEGGEGGLRERDGGDVTARKRKKFTEQKKKDGIAHQSLIRVQNAVNS